MSLLEKVEMQLTAVDDWPWPMPKGLAWDLRLWYQGRSMSTRLYSVVHETPVVHDVMWMLLRDFKAARLAGSYEEWLNLNSYTPSENAERNYTHQQQLMRDMVETFQDDIQELAQELGLV